MVSARPDYQLLSEFADDSRLDIPDNHEHYSLSDTLTAQAAGSLNRAEDRQTNWKADNLHMAGISKNFVEKNRINAADFPVPEDKQPFGPENGDFWHYN